MISCRTASNQPVTLNGESEIGFTIAGTDMKCTFQICSHLISEGIIGSDWFDEHDSVINHSYTPPMLSFDTKNGGAHIIGCSGVREIRSLECINMEQANLISLSEVKIAAGGSYLLKLIVPQSLKKELYRIMLTKKLSHKIPWLELKERIININPERILSVMVKNHKPESIYLKGNI